MPPLSPQQQRKNNTELLIEASKFGNLKKVQQLLPVSDPQHDQNLALRYAARYGHTEIVQLLVPTSDPKANNSLALHYAAANGHSDIVRLLIPITDATAYPVALRYASQNGHSNILKELILVTDAKEQQSTALLWATQNEHLECMKLLIPVSDFNTVLKYMQKQQRDTSLLEKYIEEYHIQCQQKRLLDSLDVIPTTSIKRKI